MANRENYKRVAWITVPAFISTDRFIVPELAKHYNIDWYLISKNNEKIDFLGTISEICDGKNLRFEVFNINLRNLDPRIIREYKRFLKKINNINYDLIYNVVIGIPYYMILLRKMIGNKNTLVAIHNVHVPKGGTMYWPSKLYIAFTIRNFKYFQTFSKSQKNELLRIAPEKYCDNVNFVLMDYGAPSVVERDPIITLLSFGFIRDYKRIDVLIEAAQAAFEKTQVKFKIIIAGSCENWEKYQSLIKYPELFDLRIRRIEDSEVPNLFVEADYFVAAYQDIAQSGSAIIAVNYNMPIIASKLEAFETYVEDGRTGFLIDPANKEHLVDKIVYILNNHDDVYPRLKVNIENDKYSKFSAEAVARLYIKNFETAM